MLSDEASGADAFYYADGYDLYNGYVREAYHASSGESGIIWRFDLYGGFGPASTQSSASSATSWISSTSGLFRRTPSRSTK